MTFDHAVNRFTQFNFSLDCPKIILKQDVETDSALSVSGPGYLYQDSNGVLNFKIYTGYHPDLISFLRSEMPIGELIPENRYFTIICSSLAGGEWRSSRFLPKVESDGNSCIFRGQFYQLLKDSYSSGLANLETYQINLKIKGSINFPRNRSTSRIEQVGETIQARQVNFDRALWEENNLSVSLQEEAHTTSVEFLVPRDQYQESTVSRLIESLTFVLAQELEVLTIETYTDECHGLSLRSPQRNHKPGSFLKPYNFDRFIELQNQPESVSNLFFKYFTYISQNSEDQPQASTRHKLSKRIQAVVESGSSALEIQATVLSIATEGIANDYFKKNLATDADLIQDIDKVKNWITKETFNQDRNRERMIGILNNIKGPSGSEAIKIFSDQKMDNIRFFDSWRTLRNNYAHGEQLEKGGIENCIKKINEVTTLFYSMIFDLIGYSGLRTDYSQQIWPLVSWDSTPDSTAQSQD